MTLSQEDLDDLDRAILEYFVEGRDEGRPWGKATPAEVYRGLKDAGRLAELNEPVQATIQHRIQRLTVAGHLENKFDSGCYELVDDPREDS